MGRFEGTFDWVKNVLPSDKAEKKSAIENAGPGVEDLRGDEYLKRVEMWKDQIEKGIAGGYGDEYVFTDRELGIQNMRAGGIVFVTLDNKSPLLNNPFFLEFFEDGFTKTEGDVNVVYSKTLN